jgi:hypothetical protein
MRLSIFAYHVGQIMTDPAPTKFTLHPCDGVRAEVVIEPAQNLEGPIWDRVTINGVSVGNRHGGVQYFTELVNEVKPVIEYT